MARLARRVFAGFTLVELVIVIAIIGILAAVAIPRFIDIRSEAYVAQRDGTVGAVRAGIMLVAARNQTLASPNATTFPPNLEAAWGTITGGTLGADADACNDGQGANPSPCFELVLTQPLIDTNWVQTKAGTCYTFDPPVGATKIYSYDAVNDTGRFNIVTACP